MKRARLWTLGAALGSFAAGINVGFLVPRVFAAESAAPAPEQEYVRQLVAKYGLCANQERSLRLVMQRDREEEIAVALSVETSQLPPAAQSRILWKNHRTEQRIRALLDDPQRERYDLERQGVPSTAPNTKR